MEIGLLPTNELSSRSGRGGGWSDRQLIDDFRDADGLASQFDRWVLALASATVPFRVITPSSVVVRSIKASLKALSQ